MATYYDTRKLAFFNEEYMGRVLELSASQLPKNCIAIELLHGTITTIRIPDNTDKAGWYTEDPPILVLATCKEIVEELFGTPEESSVLELAFYGHNVTYNHDKSGPYVQDNSNGKKIHIKDFENVAERY